MAFTDLDILLPVCIVGGLFFYQAVFHVIMAVRASRRSLRGKHVFITGGSKGLGRALAEECAIDGAKVTIVARNKKDLESAKAGIDSAAQSAPRTLTVSADVTDKASLVAAVAAAEEHFGTVDLLFACAGSAVTGYFMDIDDESFDRQMTLNYKGTLNAVRCVLPSMLKEKRGSIVLVSSGMALTGYIGYSAYAPSKWACRGLAETLRNELKSSNITVHSAYPPNMDTPGYQEENRTKPEETKKIEEGESLYEAEKCASALIWGLKRGYFHLSCGDFGVSLLTRMCAGMSPRENALTDLLICPVLILVAKVYVGVWDAISRKGRRYDSSPRFESSGTAL